jgi:RNA polymerase sigma-70 factor, ECF subfamily
MEEAVLDFCAAWELMIQNAPITEEELVERAIKRDQQAFTLLYDNSVDLIYRHIYYKISDQKEAEDLTQEVFIKAWKAISKYRRTEAPFKAWLLTIARNLVFDYYKGKKKVISLDEVNVLEEPSDDNIEQNYEAKENQDNIKKAILKLKGEKQSVVLMHFIDGLSYNEIAKILNKSEGAIRVIQFRALNELKKILNG